VKPALARLFANSQFLHGVDVLSNGSAVLQPRVWRYRFAPSTSPQRLPVTHGDEMPYVFGTLGSTATMDDKILSNNLGDAWVQFATRQDPHESKQLTWPHYRKNGAILVWDTPAARIRLVPEREVKLHHV